MSPVARRLFISVVAAVAIVGIGWGFQLSETEKPRLPPAIESVSPPEGDLDLRQVEVAVDLAPGFTGVLFFDGVEVPEDDLQRVAALNSIALRPQDGSPYEQLEPGPHTAAVEYWPIAMGRAAAKSHAWRFKLH